MRNHKKRGTVLLSALLTCAMLLPLAGCGDNGAAGGSTPPVQPTSSGSAQTSTPPTETLTKAIRVGLVLNPGGLGDKNFNDMAYDGLLRAQEELGVEFDYLEPQTNSDFEPYHRRLAEAGTYDLIIGLAMEQNEAVQTVSQDYPDQKFSIIDSNLDLPGIHALSTKWQEQTFLCGVLAGLGTLSDMEMANGENVIGVILGVENPNLLQGVVGFEAGAKFVNPEVEVLTAEAGSFSDPGKGKEIALSMYNREADFIQCIAGATGLGVFNGAKEAGRYAFGVGGNQNYIEPDYVVATSIRNVDEMAYNEIKSVVDGTWESGLSIRGLKEEAVGFSMENSNVQVPQDILDTIEDIRQMIVSGDLVPPTDATLEQWLADNHYSK